MSKFNMIGDRLLQRILRAEKASAGIGTTGCSTRRRCTTDSGACRTTCCDVRCCTTGGVPQCTRFNCSSAPYC